MAKLSEKQKRLDQFNKFLQRNWIVNETGVDFTLINFDGVEAEIEIREYNIGSFEQLCKLAEILKTRKINFTAATEYGYYDEVSSHVKITVSEIVCPFVKARMVE